MMFAVLSRQDLARNRWEQDRAGLVDWQNMGQGYNGNSWYSGQNLFTRKQTRANYYDMELPKPCFKLEPVLC